MDILLFAASGVSYRYFLANQQRKVSTYMHQKMSYALLQHQDAETSATIISLYSKSPAFQQLAAYENNLTVQRDREDDEKLAIGIQFAKDKQVIDPFFIPEPYIQIDVLGKTPAQVAEIILQYTRKDASAGVIVLVGLSGTGKGTTVATLRQKIEQDQGKEVVTWSNGNVFRSVTLLAATWCEQQKLATIDKALTKENIANFMKMLTFGKFKGKFDIRIHGLGLDMLVSEVQNTALKSPMVSKNIPSVAQVTQGEVILFAADAVATMSKDGIYVLLEGREQTVNYVRTPHRFELILSDDTLIGKRRAAQRMMGDALSAVSEGASIEQIQVALDSALEKMVKEIK